MRLIFLLCSLALSAQEEPAFDKLHWIAGRWTGALNQAVLEEVWLAPSGGAMLGVSRTIGGTRMLAFEFLRIVQKDGHVFYIAQPGGRPPTEFKLTRASASKAVFENPQHDFPKIITYELTAPDRLTATIEGPQRGQNRKQQFHFERAGAR